MPQPRSRSESPGAPSRPGVADAAGGDPRRRLLAGLPASERRPSLAGIPTSVLVGGEGPPIVLLHGPGESAVWWMRVIPDLVTTHRVVAPDLPGHGASGTGEASLDAARVLSWVDALIDDACPSPPVVVGHLLGGAIAARYAVARGERIRHLVLVDAMGLGPFRPSVKFALSLIRFVVWPTKRTYDRFLPHCMYDPDGLREEMGEGWDPFLEYNLERARASEARAALRRLMLRVGIPRIPPEDLARIAVPTTLIWGRHDRAIKPEVAREASDRHGWPLHVIDDARDDPKLERPEAFLSALRDALPGR